ncbi:hypothetical protein HJC23_003661 [Cyclotella cryptica]|uniref:Ribosomal protein S15 n=1 Tax=Cyclotella cryptica TaxID=29204 RepID=A0ABD3QJ13_9STRA|eukprot:CCRYP_004966-RA/>CCRYP_004966-RA protein AED:0.40 eAED:0.39 QI:0/-1/0/1/-1/1/1/0/269
MSALSLLRLTLTKSPMYASPSSLRGLCTLRWTSLPASSIATTLKATAVSTHHALPAALDSPFSLSSTSPLPTAIQVRTKITKAKRHKRAKIQERERRVARGLPPKPLPPKYIPKDTPVINAMTREERNAESAQFDLEASREMKVKIDQQAEKEETLRFSFHGLAMSDRVRRLLNLKNGSQKEVVASQKRRGMELFQLREGDTGSSAVQVVALTTRIQQMQTHLAKHKKDYSGKRGLDAMYVRRRKVLDYMERKDFESYRKVVKSLGLMR